MAAAHMVKDKNVLFIVNPKSGRGQIKYRLLEIVDLFNAAGFEVSVHVTQGPKDAADTAAKRGADYAYVLCSGGDGTLNEVASGLMEIESPPKLGYIPAGTTNDFAASLGIPKNMLSAARAVLKGRDYAVDVGRFCGDQYFLYVAGFGAFTEVSYLTSQNVKNLLGHQAYILEGMKSLSEIRSFHMMVEAGNVSFKGEFIFGMVTNAISVGGIKGLVGREVDMDDGLFEILLIRSPKTPLELMDTAASLFRGDENDQICRMQSENVHMVSAEPMDWVLDGEYGGRRHDVDIRNLKRRLIIRQNRLRR